MILNEFTKALADSASGAMSEDAREFIRRTHLATMTWDIWCRLQDYERKVLRDVSGMSPQLAGLEGWRVEVVRMDGEWKRFNVGSSGGWRPIHLELHNRASLGGAPADREYRSVRPLRKGR